MKKGKENKPHIGIYGRRNVGKSSLINNISGQEIAIVADFKGTTTDPVKRSFEITGFGPVILIDTAGIDDEGEVGKLRVQKSLKTLKEIDLAILVISENIFDVEEENLIDQFKKEGIPFFIIYNKSDLVKLNKDLQKKIQEKFNCRVIDYSVETNGNTEILLKTIKELLPESSWKITSLLGDLVSYGDVVLLITPIDIEAPQGRLILPQVQVIRDILDNDCVAIVLKEREVDSFLKKTGIKPKLAITDSQIFLKAAASIPRDIPLTGFSVLLARYKGDFDNYLIGTPKINDLKDGDKILILESCSHHVSCDDIGRVKIPRWLSNYTGKSLEYIVIAGLDEIPGKITDYALVVQCGGCVLTRKQVISRLKPAVEAGVPVTNYGMLIAFVQGIYDRAIEPFVKSNDADLNYL
ncbi:MAG TPA: [FeFe] hydrogenase H-cluster maturation GTPase HydF [Bacteroidales bacterium]|nr:[FeFe] hydrogenase H-cluster maturation GTPase HydF [Bacteroidales bacterium]HOL97292.1 [FeFe] hydrogenase H-cluster maturation GTPase HydF [Bacteroidales bacterium]HOM35585.1 [FeFe] hydrogenase H-cluster maturation GTPase HydF [Bacteroidales bacterium]HPD22870.1 [FeFe] hydrogenase H-cluster maturation GTPase HydF [Bacteroidales bacterium]HRT00553.1 [FeFe] hydrogenase H-cluster maturation GTPase HydF [Bacteroidales bacterium]